MLIVLLVFLAPLFAAGISALSYVSGRAKMHPLLAALLSLAFPTIAFGWLAVTDPGGNHALQSSVVLLLAITLSAAALGMFVGHAWTKWGRGGRLVAIAAVFGEFCLIGIFGIQSALMTYGAP